MQPEQLLAYPFNWIDQVIEVTLNPAFAMGTRPAENDIEQVRQRLPTEIRLVWSTLKQQRFSVLLMNRQADLVAGYYEYLLSARDQVLGYLSVYPDGHPVLALGHSVLEQLDGILQQLQLCYGHLLPKEVSEAKRPEDVKPSFKIKCRLSVDQVAIILKAADEICLLTSRSFSLVLRTLVPFLSTERLCHFSWKSARSSTYKMEVSDKEIVVYALEALIEKIRQF